MQRIKQFLANNKAARITCIVLAVAMVIGALGAFSSLFHRDKISEGVGYPSGHIELDGYGKRSSDYAVLYEQEGLVACYVAYGNDSITASGKDKLTWKNHVSGGKDATLYGANYWRRMNGGIGYTMNITEWEADRENVGCDVPYSLMHADGVDRFMVETVLLHSGVTDENGEIYRAPAGSYRDGVYNWNKSAFRFGMLHSLAFVAYTSGNNSRIGNRWLVSNFSPYNMYGNHTEGVDYLVLNNPLDNAVMSVLGKITLMTVGFERNITEALSMLAVNYGRIDNANTLWSSAPVAILEASEAYEYDDPAGKFSLLNGFPATLYSIRYYDHEISNETRMRNFFVDLCGFYDINVSDFFKLSSAELEEFLVNCGVSANSMNVEMDVKNVAANRAKVYEIINQNWKG